MALPAAKNVRFAYALLANDAKFPSTLIRWLFQMEREGVEQIGTLGISF